MYFVGNLGKSCLSLWYIWAWGFPVFSFSNSLDFSFKTLVCQWVCIFRTASKKLDKLPKVLSTPHGTLGTFLFPLGPKNYAGQPFNSTRYIRNGYMKNRKNKSYCLSTPHSTLGTYAVFLKLNEKLPFNSTRYIRNAEITEGYLSHLCQTFNSTRYIRNFNFSREKFDKMMTTFNSTRYIRNEPFRALLDLPVKRAFNSTRYIRNFRTCRILGRSCPTFNSTRYIRNPKRPH